MIKEILYEIINEASKGNVLIDNDPFPIGFNTYIYSSHEMINMNDNIRDNFPTLLLKNEYEFINKLTKYIEIALIK